MNHLFTTLATLAIAIAATGSAAAQDTTWFNAENKVVAPAEASFYELTAKTDSGLTFADHWLNGKLKTTGRVNVDDLKRVGTYTIYDSTGIMRHRSTWGNGMQSGPETDYYPEGQLMLEGNASMGVKDGDWTAYYPSGKLKAKANFKDGQQNAASFYNEDGSPNSTITTFFQEAGFPGGDRAWLRYMNKTLRYPDDAVNQNKQGTVVIGFIIAKDGKLANFTVIKSAGASLDNEALKLIKSSGDWNPAIYGGTPTETHKLQPIVFKLENY